MRLILFLLAWLAQGVFAQVAIAETDSLIVMTFNIRFGTAPDGDNSWPNRKEQVFELIREHNPQILGLQEALREQLDAIREELPQYSSVGVGREVDGAGEYSPLLYNRKRFDVLEAQTFWLSDTPAVRGSKTWGNNITRVCTRARLLDRKSNLVVHVYNTHWDHESQPSRVKSGELMAKRIGEANPDEPLIVMGDFNVGPLDPAREPLVRLGLRDSFVDVHPDQARPGTFHAFTGKSKSDKIDAILVSKHWQTFDAQIITKEQNGRYPSDHFSVSATLKLKEAK